MIDCSFFVVCSSRTFQPILAVVLSLRPLIRVGTFLSILGYYRCYFLAGSKGYVSEFRQSCGRIDSKSIPRIMSRLGQCFTQSRPLGIKVERGSYSGIYDYTGGEDSNGNPHIFSDGCGMVSEMHEPEQHKRMCNPIFELMEYHIESTISSLVDKSNAFVTLNEFPQYILYDRLYYFDVTEEPFFRSLLCSAALSSLHRLIDETCFLQYGQVFIQYTSNFALKFPIQHAKKLIHKGPVMITKKFNGIREPFRRICSFPSDEIRKKASAYYRIAYNNGKFLSFAWLAYDVLTYTRQKYLLKTGNFKLSLCPIIDYLSNYINDFCLDKLLFIFRKWIIKHSITYDPNNNNNEKGFYAVEDCIVNLEEHSGKIGKMFWNLIQFLMTRNFGFSERISMKPVAKNYLEPSQCRILYFAAQYTFYPLAVNRRFDGLPGTLEDQKTIQKITEGSVFLVEIPRSCVNYKQLFGQLALKCDCKYLVFRKNVILIF
uniref:RNA-dependent RNA polymerase n=1 Tax=Panagrolaimus davidi TaxID=227884 RepID=A0A914PAM2_9BILA